MIRYLSNLTIRAKLWLGFGMLVLVVIAIAGQTLWTLDGTRSRMNDVVERTQPALLNSMELLQQVEAASKSLGFYLLSQEPQHRDDYEAGLKRAEATAAALAKSEVIQSDPGLKRLVADIAQKVKAFAGYQAQMVALPLDANKNFPASAYASEKVNPLSQQSLQLLSQMVMSESEETPTPARRRLLLDLEELRYTWVNVISEVRTYLAFRNDVSRKNLANYMAKIQSLVDKLKAEQGTLNFDQADSFSQFVGVFGEFKGNLPGLLELQGGDRWRTDAWLIRTKLGELVGQIRGDLDSLVKQLRASSSQSDEVLLASVNTARTIIALLLVVGLVLAGGGVWIVSRLITRPVLRAVATMNDIAEGGGDLTRTMGMSGSDEVCQLAHAFDRFVGRIRDIVTPVNAATHELAGAANEISAITRDAEIGVQRQQSETEAVVGAMDRMAATTREMADNAGVAAEAARQADQQAQEGRRVVATTIDAIDGLASAVERAGEVIGRLGERTDNIGSVLDVITGIAEQTNLLALNAAIEAARAGEHGRGFAVVADEVRTLAMRTHESTREIQEMIEQLQQASREAAEVMEQGQGQARSSVEHAAQAGSSLEAITAAVTSITDMNRHIAEAANEQGRVAGEVNSNVGAIVEVAEQTAAGMAQLSTAVGRLTGIADQLDGLVGHFKT